MCGAFFEKSYLVKTSLQDEIKSLMLFDDLLLMVLPAIFMLLSLSRSTCIYPRTNVRYFGAEQRALHEIALSGAVRMN